MKKMIVNPPFSAESHTYFASDKDPPYILELIKECEFSDCRRGEVFSACHICNQLLCYTRFRNTGPCEDDHKFFHQEQNSRNKKTDTACTSMKNLVPEDFIVDGSEKEEGAQPRIAKRNETKKIKAHESRSRSEEYVSVKTGKIVHARNDLKPRCRHKLLDMKK